MQIAIITKLINNTKFKIDKGDHLLDTHTHILWNIDDGSKNQCMSLQMLEIAARSGTKAIFATPHVIERANKPSWEEIKEKTQQLRQLCAEAQIDIMLYPGAEVQMNWELLPELGATGAYCLNGGRYLLVELPAAEIPAYADEFWYELELKGIMPILAHPERYQQLRENPDLLLLWRRRGMLMQCNSGSFTGMFGSSVCENAKVLLANGLVDLLGSDGRRTQYGYVTGSGGHQAAGRRRSTAADDRNEPAGDLKKSGNRAQAAQSIFRRQTKELLAETLWQIIN